MNNYHQPFANYAMTKKEILQNLANRILHHSLYKAFYLVMGFLSVICVILSIIERCPSGYFYILEVIINLGMILEVTIRFFAFGKNFWNSKWNMFDVVLVFFCFLTLFILMVGECSSTRTREAEADAFLLILRNGIQFSRLMVVLKKNNTQLSNRATTINFENIDSRAFDDSSFDTRRTTYTDDFDDNFF
ncbi:hypothetical protein HDU92_004048 [Lobulomyces angularis]|nr:hypothetical protein HDU92_004048 [Lobulomyces angularis]